MIQFQYWIDVIDRQSFRGSKAIEAAGRFSLAHSPADSSNPERRIRNVVVICIERNGSTCVIGESDFSVVQFFLLFVLFLFFDSISFHFIVDETVPPTRAPPTAPHGVRNFFFAFRFFFFVFFFAFRNFRSNRSSSDRFTRFYQVLPGFTGFYRVLLGFT